MLTLPDLPFKRNALEPHISEEIINFHYGKHHKGYVDNTNKLVKGTEYEDLELEEIIKRANGPIFDNAAQAWSHTFYWNCLTPDSNEDDISNELRGAIDEQFKSLGGLKKEFSKKGTKLFGSGWVWLIQQGNELQIQNMRNADNPIRKGSKGLLVIDVWEHSYYLDYKNDRAAYLEAIWNVVNWKFVSDNYKP